MSKEIYSKTRFENYYGSHAINNSLFINFGAGNWKHPYFKNMDIEHPNYPNNKPDYIYNAFNKKPFQIENSSVKIFYLSHVNEHLPDEINIFIFSEIFRCLEKGGVLRIVYPDFDKALNAYSKQDKDFFLYQWRRGDKARSARLEHSIERLFLDFFATRAQQGSANDGNKKYSDNEFKALLENKGPQLTADQICENMSWDAQLAAPGCHINWWNYSKFETILKITGFTEIQKSGFMQSTIPPLRDDFFFDNTEVAISSYVECIK